MKMVLCAFAAVCWIFLFMRPSQCAKCALPLGCSRKCYAFAACREVPGDGPAFSIAGRPTKDAAHAAAADTPGPGQYDTTCGAAAAAAGSAAAPAWSIAGRVPGAAAAAAATKALWPGPGSYQVSVQGAQGPAYSIQGRPKAAGGTLVVVTLRDGSCLHNPACCSILTWQLPNTHTCSLALQAQVAFEV